MSKKIVFDGAIYTGKINGLYRYTDELLRELDKIINKDEYEVVVPAYVDLKNKFNNLKVVYYGNMRGVLWTQICLAQYLFKNDAISIGFCNVTPLLKPGITVVHDVGYKVLKQYYKNMYGRLSQYWHRLNYWIIAHGKYPIITVSEFSKDQISDIYKVKAERITVIENGWQHYSRIAEDDSIFEEIPRIKKGEYFFSLGSLEERKNFKWVIEVAKRNKQACFVVAGNDVRNAKNKPEFDKILNIIFLGYISDEKVKSLMRNCTAFLFPSIFEGFGIPPLEAMSVGTRVICANSASLPEICGKAVDYIDPYQYDVDLKSMESSDKRKYYNMILNKYSWEKSAGKLYKFLKGINLQ